MRAGSLLIVLLLAACGGYDPPFKGDHAAPKYRTDLARCRQQAHDTAEQIAGDTPATKIASFFRSNEPERANVRSCMVGKGYALP